ncbi:MAG TPA: hypothetical protein VL220_08540 [Steroidobacteraceae bacterium]|nr:hypothetical protein [Steroidobacteraceae bacterium]
MADVRGRVELVVPLLEILGRGAQRVRLSANVIAHEKYVPEAGREGALRHPAHHCLEGLGIDRHASGKPQCPVRSSREPVGANGMVG